MKSSPDELRSQLTALLELQSIDRELSSVREELAAIDRLESCQDMQEQVAAAEQRLAREEQKLAELARQAKYWEQESGAMRSESIELERKMYGGEVSNLKELEQAEKRVVQLKKKADELEDQALNAFDDIELREQKVQACRTQVEQFKVKLVDDSKELTVRRERARQRETELTALRLEVVPRIEPALLARYDFLAPKKAGVAIVGMRDNTCTGCRVSVPVILANRVRRFEDMIPCENCGRILCWVE